MTTHDGAASLVLAATRHSGPPMSPTAAAEALIAFGLFASFFGGMLILGTRGSPADPDQHPPGSPTAHRRRWAHVRLYTLTVMGAAAIIAGIVRLIVIAA